MSGDCFKGAVKVWISFTERQEDRKAASNLITQIEFMDRKNTHHKYQSL